MPSFAQGALNTVAALQALLVCDGRLGATLAKTIPGPTHQTTSSQMRLQMTDGRLGATVAKTSTGPTHQATSNHYSTFISIHGTQVATHRVNVAGRWPTDWVA